MNIKDLTFVFVGPPARIMEHNVSFIRKHYPAARIYTSFTETPTISYNPDPNTISDAFEFYSRNKTDLILANKDPGKLSDDGNSSINRRILNTQSILRLIQTSHIAMFRADCIIDTPYLEQLYKYYQTFPIPSAAHSLFDERVVISDHFTVNPFGNLRLLNHPGDHFHIGRTDILQKWFNSIPLRTEEELYKNGIVSSRPEQYLCPECMQSNLENHTYWDKDGAKRWLNYLVANFAVDSTYFRSQKYPHQLGDDFVSTSLWKTLTYAL